MQKLIDEINKDYWNMRRDVRRITAVISEDRVCFTTHGMEVRGANICRMNDIIHVARSVFENIVSVEWNDGHITIRTGAYATSFPYDPNLESVRPVDDYNARVIPTEDVVHEDFSYIPATTDALVAFCKTELFARLRTEVGNNLCIGFKLNASICPGPYPSENWRVTAVFQVNPNGLPEKNRTLTVGAMAAGGLELAHIGKVMRKRIRFPDMSIYVYYCASNQSITARAAYKFSSDPRDRYVELTIPVKYAIQSPE